MVGNEVAADRAETIDVVASVCKSLLFDSQSNDELLPAAERWVGCLQLSQRRQKLLPCLRFPVRIDMQLNHAGPLSTSIILSF